MKTNKSNLMKHFASVLRKRALGKNNGSEAIDLKILDSLIRKDLIQIIKQKHGGSIPKTLDLMELENKELLSHIGDDMFIIAFMTQKWSGEQEEYADVNLKKELDKSISKAVVKEDKTKKETPKNPNQVKKK